MGTTTSQSKLLLNEICVSVVIVPQKGIEPPKSYLYARDLQSPELTTCSTTAFIVGKLGYAPNPIVFQTIASTKLASSPLCSHSRTRTYTPLINSQVHYSILLCENICFHMRTWTPIYRFVACRSFHWTMWKNCTDSRSRTHIKWFGVICLTIRRCPYLTFVSVGQALVLYFKIFN